MEKKPTEPNPHPVDVFEHDAVYLSLVLRSTIESRLDSNRRTILDETLAGVV